MNENEAYEVWRFVAVGCVSAGELGKFGYAFGLNPGDTLEISGPQSLLSKIKVENMVDIFGPRMQVASHYLRRDYTSPKNWFYFEELVSSW